MRKEWYVLEYSPRGKNRWYTDNSKTFSTKKEALAYFHKYPFEYPADIFEYRLKFVVSEERVICSIALERKKK